MRTAAAVLAAILLIAAGHAQAPEPPLPLDEYWQRVQELRALVATMKEAPAETDRARLLAEADRWEKVSAVLLPDGTRVPLDHGFLLSLLRADPPALVELHGLLDALLAARESWPKVGRAAQDLAVLDRILARPEFQWQPSPLAAWWQRILEAIARLLSGGGGEGLSLLRWLLTSLGVLVLIGALAYVLRRLLAGWVAESEVEQKAEAGEGDLTAAAALKRAQGFAGDGDYRAAVRYLYLSSLLLLEERGLLRYDRSLTNREHLRSVAQSAQLAAILGEVVDVFERVWYGFQPLDEAGYTRYEVRITDLQRLR